jgi:O-antigen ligase
VNLVASHIASLTGLHLPPPLALFLTLALIVFLFRRDIREKPNVSGALWLPLIWLLLACSRPLSSWLKLAGLPVSGPGSVQEGSPLDACFYLVLATASIWVLSQRQVDLPEIVSNNGFIIAFFLYCFISVAWSDFPLVSFKQSIKILAHPMMALIVLTEPDFEEALRRLMKRCAYVVVPVSILWIKYYPQYGMTYDDWGGQMIQGIAVGKNSLGADCLILGFFFFWHLLQTWRTERSTQRRNELRLSAGFLIGIGWLFAKARSIQQRNELRLIAGFLIGILYLLRLSHSATSTICLFVAILIVLFVGIRPTIKNFIGTYTLAALALLVAAELAFGISGRLSESLGRGATLTGRTELWEYCLKFQDSPIVGVGFESFFLGERRDKIAAFYTKWRPGGAHNGYLSIYLNLGLIGLSLLIVLLIATFWKIRRELFRNFEWGRFRLGFLMAVVLRAWTEETFATYGSLWFVFYIIALDYPRTYLMTAEPSVEASRSEESKELAYARGEL